MGLYRIGPVFIEVSDLYEGYRNFLTAPPKGEIKDQVQITVSEEPISLESAIMVGQYRDMRVFKNHAVDGSVIWFSKKKMGAEYSE